MKCDKLKAMSVSDAYEEYELNPTDESRHYVYYKVKVDKVIDELKANYKEAFGRLQTANLIAKEQKEKTDKLLSCLKNLVMSDLIKDCPMKEIAVKIVKEYD
jgi:hypothetical protein